MNVTGKQTDHSTLPIDEIALSDVTYKCDPTQLALHQPILLNKATGIETCVNQNTVVYRQECGSHAAHWAVDCRQIQVQWWYQQRDPVLCLSAPTQTYQTHQVHSAAADQAAYRPFCRLTILAEPNTQKVSLN